MAGQRSNMGPASSLAGKPVSQTAPTSGHVLGYNGTNWLSSSLAGTGVASQGTFAARPAAGTAGRFYWATDTAVMYYDDGSAWQAVAATGGSMPEKAILGGQLTYVSATTLTVEPVKARDSGNTTDLSQSSRRTLDVTSVNADLGLERKQLTGQVTFNATTAVTGTGTAFLTEFAPGNAPRSLTGTIGTGGAASTTITGSSTLFLDELAVGDLIGNGTVGYSRVTAIASQTSLTVTSNLTISDGSTGKVIEFPTIEAGNGGDVSLVQAIASDTALTIDSTSANANLTGYVGKRPTTAQGCRLHVWLSASGILYLSTQYTTPFATIASVGTAHRRLGCIPVDSSSNFVPIRTLGEGRTRDFLLDIGNTASGSRVLSGGNAAAWTAVSCGNLISQMAVALLASLYLAVPTAGGAVTFHVRRRNSGSATASRNQYCVAQSNLTNVNANVLAEVPCGRGGEIDYALSAAGGSPAYIELFGWREDL